MGTCGLTEEQAIERIDGDIDVYVSKFKPMKNTISGVDEKTLIKIIVEAETDLVRELGSDLWLGLRVRS